MSEIQPPTSRIYGEETPRAALLREITRHGVTHGTHEKPIVSRDGRLGTRWVMSFLGVGLREPWLSHACDLLLERLDGFEGKQLATIGLAASSLLSGCVMRSEGRYSGMILRETAKAHGSGKQIEGLPDPSEPVIIIDDAIGTGHSALTSARILEENGFEVEGIICVVRFTYDSGFGLLEENGYRVCALYDVHDDLVPVLEPETLPDPEPWRAKDIRWQEDTAPDGLSPFALARLYLRAAMVEGAMPRPPENLAMPLPCEGGLWVSLRRLDNGAQAARMGSWVFPEDVSPCAPQALANACWMLAKLLPKGENGLAWLDACGLALSMFGPLRACMAGEIDNGRFGIVARSKERARVVGAALPDMPGIHGSGHQLRHAVHINGRIRALEPFTLYRHTVDKLIEPGAPWPPRGISLRAPILPENRDATAQALIERARAILDGATPDTEAVFLLDAEYLFLSIYDASDQVACIGRRCHTVAGFDALVHGAASDPRAAGRDRRDLILRLSVLENGWSQRGTPPAFCSGVDALCLSVQGRESILLPEVAIAENLDAEAFQALLLTKAGAVPDDTHIWTTLHVTCWDEGRVSPSNPSFWVAQNTPTTDRREAAIGWAQWLATHILQDTLPEAFLPLGGERLGAAQTALRDAAIWRVAQVAAALCIDAHAIPQTPVYGVLHHGARASSKIDALASAILTAQPFPDARTEPAAFWLGLRALASVPNIEDQDAFTALLKRARRRLDAPALPGERLLRLAALCMLTKHDLADMRAIIERDALWVHGSVSADGLFITAQRDIEETLVTAQAAEALAMAAPLLGISDLGDMAGRCLDSLTALSVRAPEGGAVVRSSGVQSGAHTSHTVAALGAYAAWMDLA